MAAGKKGVLLACARARGALVGWELSVSGMARVYHCHMSPESYKRGAYQSVCAKGNRSELRILEDFGVPARVAGARLVCAVRA